MTKDFDKINKRPKRGSVIRIPLPTKLFCCECGKSLSQFTPMYCPLCRDDKISEKASEYCDGCTKCESCDICSECTIYADLDSAKNTIDELKKKLKILEEEGF